MNGVPMTQKATNKKLLLNRHIPIAQGCRIVNLDSASYKVVVFLRSLKSFYSKF